MKKSDFNDYNDYINSVIEKHENKEKFIDEQINGMFNRDENIVKKNISKLEELLGGD